SQRPGATSRTSAYTAGWCRPASAAADRQDQLEAGPAVPTLVDEVAGVSPGVSACDRKSETAAATAVVAHETVEQVSLELLGNAAAVIVDGDVEMTLVLSSRHDYRRAAVSHGIAQQIGEDPLERERVGEDGEILR